MSWRFARRPWWLLSHLLVLVLIVALAWAGFWQLRRLDDRRATNALIEERSELPVADVTEVVPAGPGVRDPEVAAARYRRVAATGTYVDADTVIVDNRSLNGAPGGWVLTPLRLDGQPEGGTAVVVNRGFIGFTRAGDLVAPPAPAGTVTVEGLVQLSEQRGRFGATEPAQGRLDLLVRVDVARIAAQAGDDLLPAYLQRTASVPDEAPPADGQPALLTLPEPELSEGPHLAYAVQWFIFTTIAVAGYPLVLRRVARDAARAGGAGDHPDGGPGGDGPGPGDDAAGDHRGDPGDDLDRGLRDLLAAEGG